MADNRKIRILQVFGSLDMGGAETRMMDVFRHLNHEKYAFDFLVFQTKQQYYEDEIIKLGGKVWKCNPPSIEKILSVVRQVRRVLRAGHYDAVHAHVSYFCGIVMYAAMKEHIQVRICHARTAGSMRGGVTYRINEKIGKLLIKKYATHCLAVSKEAGSFLFDSQIYEVLPNAIDVKKIIDISNENIDEIAKQYELSKNLNIIGHIGRFDSVKNHDFILHWFHQYHELHENAYLVLVGEGPLREQMMQMADEMGLRDAIRFTGKTNRVYELLHLFSVLILPSKYEGLPGVVLEAQAAGIPSVVSKNITQEVDMGLSLVKWCNLEYADWSNTVDSCIYLETPDKSKIIKAFNEKHFSIDYLVDKLEKIYEGLPQEGLL